MSDFSDEKNSAKAFICSVLLNEVFIVWPWLWEGLSTAHLWNFPALSGMLHAAMSPLSQGMMASGLKGCFVLKLSQFSELNNSVATRMVKSSFSVNRETLCLTSQRNGRIEKSRFLSDRTINIHP